MSKVKASEFRKMLMDLGYTPVHVWYESHGDGSHETFQQTAHPLKGTDVLHPVSKWGGKFCIFTVYVESDGTVSGFNQEISSHDYVLATQIREDQKLRPKENREYLPVQDHAAELEFVVQAGRHQVDGLQQLAQPVQGEKVRLQGDKHLVDRGQEPLAVGQLDNLLCGS